MPDIINLDCDNNAQLVESPVSRRRGQHRHCMPADRQVIADPHLVDSAVLCAMAST